MAGTGQAIGASVGTVGQGGQAVSPDGFYRANNQGEYDALIAQGIDPGKILTLQNPDGKPGSNNPPYYTGADPNAIHTEQVLDPVSGQYVTIKVNGKGDWDRTDAATNDFAVHTTGANTPPTVSPKTIVNTVLHPIDTYNTIKGEVNQVRNGNTTFFPGDPNVAGNGGRNNSADPNTGGGSGGGGGGTGSPTIDTSGAQSDINRARSLADQFNDAYKNFTPATAPTIGGVTLAPQTMATAGQVGNIPQVVAPTVGPAQQSVAGQIGALQQAGAGSATGGVATAGTAAAGTVGPYEKALAERLDAEKQAEFREKQNTLLGYLTGAIEGTAPSVAKLQLDQATERNAANQLGLAAAASRGGNSPLALRTAANNIAQINQRAAADAALLRAQEIATARGQYGDVANTGRGQDINLADRNATLGTQVNLTNATNQLDQQKTQAGLDTNTSIANAGNQTQASVATAGNQTQASVANANNATNSSIANANNSAAAQIAAARMATDVSTNNATNATTLQALQAKILYDASHDNAGNALSAAQTQANLDTEASKTNATNATNLATAQGRINADVNINNANNQVTTAGQDITRQQNSAQNTIDATKTAAATDVGLANAQAAATSANAAAKNANTNASDSAWKRTTDVITGLGTAAAVLSDENEKTDVADGKADAQSLLDALRPRSFNYKNPADGAGRKTGVMAQDVERSPAGRGFVRETPRGKALDPVQGFGSVLAMLAQLNDRTKRLEGARV